MRASRFPPGCGHRASRRSPLRTDCGTGGKGTWNLRLAPAVGFRFRTRGWLATAAGRPWASSSLLLGVILYVTTDYGTIKIELSDPSAKDEVEIDGDTVEIAGLKDPLKLKAGPHELLVTSREFKTMTQSFTLRRGGNPVLTVTLEPGARQDRTDRPSDG